MSDLAAVFEKIADINHWGSSESVSGQGSTLAYTYNLRRELPNFFRAFGVRSMFDAPCGDFNWMRAVEFPADFTYIGGDVVPSLAANNAARYGAPARSFLAFDIVSDPLPEVDLWFCRDCLFHLPLGAIGAALRNFVRSRVAYLMTTTHLNVDNFVNTEIEAGGFRRLDLYLPPFNLPKDVFYRIPDYIFPYPQRELVVWTRGQVAAALAPPTF